MAAALWSSANKRVQTAFTDRTRMSYYAQFRLFIALSVYLSIADFTSLSFVLMFVEYLHVQGLKYPTVLNYVSVVRHYFAYYSLPLQNVNHKKVKMLLKSIAMNATYVPRFKGIVTIPILKDIVTYCNHIKHGVVYQSIFLLAFFGYLRLARIVPSSAKFSLHKVLLRKHFFRCPLGFKVHIPSTKTHQLYFQYHEIFIPFIEGSSLCPVTALTTMFQMFPASPDSPAFIVPRGRNHIPLLAYMVRQTLAKIIMSLQLDPSAFTFHVYRRSGATFSFNNNVAFQDIRLQGSWKSDAIYTYLQSTNASHKVAQSFQTLLHHV